ncbi:MAG: hypothetical protein U1E78_07315 [Gammaproteobacteria bacterium]
MDDTFNSFFLPKILIGVFFISGTILSAGLCEFVPIKLNMEIALTANLVFIVLACLRHFYTDMKAHNQQEDALTNTLIDQLEAEAGEHPSRHLAWTILKEKLEQEPSLIVRLKTLSEYQANPVARANLMKMLLEEQSQMDVLEMLGLRWTNSPNESYQKKSA